ncbi:glycine/D-amino acid oxidase, deaminating [Candidatus Methanoperedens nitroreducens]|uniref:Glycine/D-amino acid oxidase, deaminating n=1 Tax=Candidatus Methanoperedens nitratireducens TaxID=1392998 RepID=A0A062V702_9EURY|nr:FAD-binding oxidoreductase [Candidatus Methanoperedens nitroreducens]KCZ71554.1 glycine/D-amino acid oxidase, deaminating [Candidatus Methanoperedens nitroreducens]MDJ1421181.1 FAD-binding oxidoreductase [Candidatus Methanoperedens sp.]
MNFDYIIVGAGVIGSSIAYYLKSALQDSKILLLDKNHSAGAGNTARSAALYRNFFSSHTSRVLAGSSIRYYLELGDKVQLDPIGYLWLFSEEQWADSQNGIQQLDPIKDKFEVLDRAAISDILRLNHKAKAPFPDVYAGIYCHLCGSISGMALAQHYASEFKSIGGDVSFDTDIKSFILTGQNSRYAPWDEVKVSGIVDQESNTYHGTQFVIATGAWIHDLLAPIGIVSGILPKKRQLFGLTIKDPAQLLMNHNSTKKPAVILPAGGVYIKPILDKNILIVGCADDLGQPYLMSDPEPDPLYFHSAIEPVLNHYFPELKNYKLSLKWAGYYDYHWPDMTPVIESVANLTWVGGTSGSGIMKADAIGRIAAARLQGHEEAILADGVKFKVSKLSLRDREVEKEELII